MIKNTSHHYGWPAKFFHWLTVPILILLFCLGLWMVDLDYDDYWYDAAPFYHEGLGVFFAALLMIRFGWKLYNQAPTPSASLSKLEKNLATITHYLLYLLCTLLCITGYLMPTADGRALAVFNWFYIPSLGSFHPLQADIAGFLHYWIAWLTVCTASIHGLAAIKHHIIDKDHTLKKML
ncbi:cytochrome b [Eionea flava]